MPETEFLTAAAPLFIGLEVEVLEWSFDMGWGKHPPSEMVQALLRSYSEQSRLIGHGVSFSILSGEWTAHHQWWKEQLIREVSIRKYQHVSEHFGFMTAGNFHRGAPLPVPLLPELLELGQERLQVLAGMLDCPLGLENLALAFCEEDVRSQGEFLERLLAPVDGFLLLDLHNLYCQAHNFSIDPKQLILSYPLDRVREVHVSGGSWAQPPSADRPIRRDTHDEAVPDEVFAMLEDALELCPAVEAVIFERLGNTFFHSDDTERYLADFRRIKSIVEGAHHESQQSQHRALSGAVTGSA